MWSSFTDFVFAQGAAERSQCYGPILEQLKTLCPLSNRSDIACTMNLGFNDTSRSAKIVLLNQRCFILIKSINTL